MGEEKLFVRRFIITTFVSLYIITSLVSMVHVIAFFRLSNPEWLAITLSIAYEIGAAASLAAIIALRKMNKSIVWGLFITLTMMQAMGNTYFAYINLDSYQSWSELFNLIDMDSITQKRILSLVSGAILPVIALGFIKALIDYIRPDDEKQNAVEDKTEPKEIKTLFTPKQSLNNPILIEEGVIDEPINDKSIIEESADVEPIIAEDSINANMVDKGVIEIPISQVVANDKTLIEEPNINIPVIEDTINNKEVLDEPITENELNFLNKIKYYNANK